MQARYSHIPHGCPAQSARSHRKKAWAGTPGLPELAGIGILPRRIGVGKGAATTWPNPEKPDVRTDRWRTSFLRGLVSRHHEWHCNNVTVVDFGRQTRRTATLRKTAYHEAGHAAMAYELGLAIRSATIREDAVHNTLGEVMFSGSPGWAIPDKREFDVQRALRYWQKHVMVDFAGQIAEKLYTGRVLQASHSGDDHHALDLALRLTISGESATAWLHWLFVSVRDELSMPAQQVAVAQLAQALMQHETLSGRQIRQILRDADAVEAGDGELMVRKLHPCRSPWGNVRVTVNSVG
jgi:hypothetical protein